MEWLTNVGALVSRPLFENPDDDLIADFGEGLVREQVKTSTCWRNGRYEVTTAGREPELERTCQASRHLPM